MNELVFMIAIITQYIGYLFGLSFILLGLYAIYIKYVDKSPKKNTRIKGQFFRFFYSLQGVLFILLLLSIVIMVLFALSGYFMKL